MDRTEAYGLPVATGLITYGSAIKEEVKLTTLLEDFHAAIDNVEPKGETKMIDAIDLAATKLIAYRKQHKIRHPNIKLPRLRILCFTDGVDTKSEKKAYKVAARLQKKNIVLDAVSVDDSLSNSGSQVNNTLHQMAKATRGYSFMPRTLKDALLLNELETVLSCESRESLTHPVSVKVTSEKKLKSFGWESVDVCDEHTVPERVQNPALENSVTTLADFLAGNETKTADGGSNKANKSNTTNTATGESKPASTIASRKCTKRLMKELRLLKKKPHDMIRIYPSEENIQFWRVLIEGPESTPYHKGVWLLTIDFPDDFPRSPPSVRFVTKILHCNINSYGRVCHSILDRNWSSETRIKTVLDCLYGLLLVPDVDSPLDSTLALARADDSGGYEGKIIAHTQTYARGGTMDSWEKELLH